ncbi:hypothetical protein EI555_018638, partial [Monodon monoceros]
LATTGCHGDRGYYARASAQARPGMPASAQRSCLDPGETPPDAPCLSGSGRCRLGRLAQSIRAGVARAGTWRAGCIPAASPWPVWAIRSREEARAPEVVEAQAVASLALAAARKVKKEPGWAAEVGSALKMENPDGWNDVEDEGDPLEPLVQKAGAKTCPRRKKQKKTPEQEPVPWKKSRGNHSHSRIYQEQQKALCEAGGVSFEEGPSKINPPHDAQAEAASPGVASESDHDGGPEGPPKKNTMVWASAKSPAPTRKKKKVSLGPVSYVLVDSEDTRKKPEIPKKGQGSRRDALDQKALRSPQHAKPPASTSQGPKAKPQGSPHASSGENDSRSHLGCVNKWLKGEEQHGQVGTEEPKGTEGPMVVEEDPSAVEGGPTQFVEIQLSEEKLLAHSKLIFPKFSFFQRRIEAVSGLKV